MKKILLLTLLTLMVALPSLADETRHQSYVSYDDGGTVVRSGDEGREIEVHRNLPVYPGDEVITSRRGRAEVRLSDGNIIGVDRTTAIKFLSILDAFEGDADETVAELRYGKIAIHRTDLGRDHVRLDTRNASYVAEREALYSVETDQHGRDRVTVFEGAVEVRTPSRATRLRAGETASVDDDGTYDLIGDQRDAADDFERWFLRRAERFGSYSNKYVDRRLGYWADDLDDHGRWVFVTGVGWSWRPHVAVGWRPYHNGYWHHSRWGGLTWVSYDPWGWGTYHYGRWAYDPGFGWVWVPGYGYSPAWVYWTYGPNYVGWAPAGWWECYRPYYNWAYHPYRSRHHNFGFYGRVRVGELDLRPWTFVDSGVLVSNRIDRVALTTDLIKQRLTRTPDGWATLSGGAARFTREELRDPADAIRRRGLDGRLTGRETGAPATDLTPFVRRENEIGGSVRDRIVRSRGGSGGDVASGGSGGSRTGSIGGGGLAPIGGGNTAPVGRGGLAPVTGGSVAPIDGGRGRVNRGGSVAPTEPSRGTIGGGDSSNNNNGGNSSTPSRGSWRDRVIDRGSETPRATEPVTSAPADNTSRSRGDASWRQRTRSSDPENGSTANSGSSDVPRRVIDRIGGARVVPRDSATPSSGSSNSGSRETVRDRGSRDSGSSGSRDRGTSTRDSGSRGSSGSSGGSRSGSFTPRSDGGSRSSGSSTSSGSSGRTSGGSSGGSREGGGRIKRD
ncbi:MAG TPA: DUF6600 domain-containing protein [Thermoanaerobaculia bacterium]|nr:DUF6600 domain-containing protein [Thermoanaerobaculia bacterium]